MSACQWMRSITASVTVVFPSTGSQIAPYAIAVTLSSLALNPPKSKPTSLLAGGLNNKAFQLVASREGQVFGVTGRQRG